MALAKLAQEDPTFKVHTDPESGQTIISGMGELHLEIIVDRMMREFKVEANVGKPQVAYRETIRRQSEAEGKYIRQTGGRGQYGHAKIRLEMKATSDLYSGVSGTVTEVNAKLSSEPGVINQDPYAAGWMIKVKADDVKQVEKLLGVEDYLKKAGH